MSGKPVGIVNTTLTAGEGNRSRGFGADAGNRAENRKDFTGVRRRSERRGCRPPRLSFRFSNGFRCSPIKSKIRLPMSLAEMSLRVGSASSRDGRGHLRGPPGRRRMVRPAERNRFLSGLKHHGVKERKRLRERRRIRGRGRTAGVKRRGEKVPIRLFEVKRRGTRIGGEGGGERKGDRNRKVVGAKVMKNGPRATGRDRSRNKRKIRGRTRTRRTIKKSGNGGVIKTRKRGRIKPRKERIAKGVVRSKERVPGRVVDIEVAKDESGG